MTTDIYSDLESLGVLKRAHVPPKYSWLTPAEKQALVMVLLHGEEGLHKKAVNTFKKDPDLEIALTNLELNSLLEWERDNNGREMYLVLSWQGDEIANLLLAHEKHKQKVANAELSPNNLTD